MMHFSVMNRRRQHPSERDEVRCYIEGGTFEQFLKIQNLSGYPARLSEVECFEYGILFKEEKFATKAQFLAEHHRMFSTAQAVVPRARVESVYYRACEDSAKFWHFS